MNRPPFSALLWGSLLVDALICAFLIWAPWRRREAVGIRVIHLFDVLAVVTAILVVNFIKLGLVMTGALSGFGLMHMAYLDAVILAPLVAAAVLVLSSRRTESTLKLRVTRPALCACLLALAGAPLGAYASYVEPERLVVERAEIPVPTGCGGARPIRIGVLADFQTDRIGAHERRAIDELLAAEPDIILMPGDLFHGLRDAFDAQLPALREQMARLSAPGGVYFVPGDVERWWPDYAGRAFEGTRVRVLVNEIAQTTLGDRTVTIAGTELRYFSDEARRTIRELERLPERGDYRILLTHRPDVALDLDAGSRINLVVAGHTHGGQVCIPFFGPPITFSKVPRGVGAGGLHELGGNLIYVSRGVGHERGEAPRIRFLCPPEISVLTLPSGRGALAHSDRDSGR